MRALLCVLCLAWVVTGASCVPASHFDGCELILALADLTGESFDLLEVTVTVGEEEFLLTRLPADLTPENLLRLGLVSADVARLSVAASRDGTCLQQGAVEVPFADGCQVVSVPLGACP